MSITECPECGEEFLMRSRNFVSIVYDTIFGTLAVQCPECDHLIGIKILKDGEVVED